MTVLSLYSKQFLVTAIHVLPDMMYFFTFGIVYTLIYRYLLRKPKAMSNFPFTLVCCPRAGRSTSSSLTSSKS